MTRSRMDASFLIENFSTLEEYQRRERDERERKEERERERGERERERESEREKRRERRERKHILRNVLCAWLWGGGGVKKCFFLDRD